ncbi:highwire, putative [Ixodes scapularis]|uniref:Highwire, putative n=1 Tax=Ixodes scapularis TaxID=6945 RepID=B7QBA3_IXOSC|nr:highwire, putative [Ixodes scapularis]|eukprot:XP_002412829.1 highwire, putative [Ixodes scapularis]
MRKFFAKYSAGLRIRSHPSLQSKQIGIVQINGTVTFVDELHNDDGVWVRLSPETIKTYCHNGYSEAWCLQYNQHLGKTLLVPIEESKSVLEEFFSDKVALKKKEELKEQHIQQQLHQQQAQQQQHQQQQQQMMRRGPGMYQVVRCGASGHNIRSKPNLKAPPVGMLVMGSTVVALEEVANAEGVWLRLSRDSMQQHCFSAEGEAWSLARTSSLAPEVVYLRHESELMQSGDSDEEVAPAKGGALNHVAAWTGPKGYAFTVPAGNSERNAAGAGASTPSTSTNALAESERTDPLSERSDPPTSSGSTSGPAPHHPQPRHWTRTDSPPPPVRTLPPELRGVSVRDLVRAIGESRANGNGVTPPGTPPSTPPVRRRRSSATSPSPAANPVLHPVTIPALRPSPKSAVATSSPVPIPGTGAIAISCSDPAVGGGLDSVGGSRRHGDGMGSQGSQGSLGESMSPIRPPVPLPRRGSVQSEGSVSSHLGSFFRELRDTSTTGCIGCITQRTTDSPLSTPGTPKKPSAALTKLVSSELDSSAADLTIQRPVMQFVLQRHDLDSMRVAIQQSLRKATCRVYAMQAFNWLLRNVTQPTCLHDLLWCLVAALSPPAPERQEEEAEAKDDLSHRKDVGGAELDREAPCEHPLSDMALAGEACCGPLRASFHALLQTVSDLMVFLPAGAALQQMAMQCWRLRFLPSDHAFLHRSHVFSNISRILSHSEEEAATGGDLAALPVAAPTAEPGAVAQALTTTIEVLRDLTPMTEVKASSRQAMANSLSDNSTETFWESGDEDRNKTKLLTLSCPPQARPTMVCVHVDNCRDLALW